MDSTQKYESHSTCKSVRHDRYTDDLPTMYQEVAEHQSTSSDTVSGRGSRDHEVEHDTLFGGRLKTRWYDSQNRGGSQKLRNKFQDHAVIPVIMDKHYKQSILIAQKWSSCEPIPIPKEPRTNSLKYRSLEIGP